MRLLTIVALLALPSAAWAEKSVRFEAVAVELRFADDWTAEALHLKDGYELTPSGGSPVGTVELRSDASCAQMIEAKQEAEPLPIGAWAVTSSAWTGYGYGEGMGYYCRDAPIDGVAYIFLVEGKMEELGMITTIVDEAVDRFGAAAPVTVAGGGKVRLPDSNLEVELPASWTAEAAEDGSDSITSAGEWIGDFDLFRSTCAAFLSKLLSTSKLPASPPSRDVGSWTGHAFVSAQDGTSYHMVCRDLVIKGVAQAATLFAPDETITELVHLFDPALDAYVATLAPEQPKEPSPPRQDSPSPAWYTFLPDRYELGIARLTDGDSGMLTDDEGWGASLNIERTTYGRGVPAWGYRARATPTGAGFAGHAEGTLGASFRGASIHAVVGVGLAGDAAPLAVHGGIHAGLLLPFFELEGGYARTPNGSVVRIEGGFLIPAGGWGAGIRFGYERREDSTMITIDWGAVRFPTSLR